MSDPLHISPQVAEAAQSTRTPSSVLLAREIERQRKAFEEWLATRPDVRQAVAESRNPSMTKACLLMAYSGGFSDGYRAGMLEAVASFVAS